MPIDYSNITTDNEFIEYFIYFYEYTFTLIDIDELNIREELNKIIEKKPFKNYKDLWIYTYLHISYRLIEDFPLELLKDTIKSMEKEFKITNPAILEIQLELLKDTFHNLDLPILEIRPYEQLSMSASYGAFLKKKEKELINFFESFQDFFSDNLLNRACYTKLAKQIYIDKKTLLFEFYSVTLFENIHDIKKDSEFDINVNVEDSILDFIKTFKKGKLNKELLEKLIDITKNLIQEYTNFKI